MNKKKQRLNLFMIVCKCSLSQFLAFKVNVTNQCKSVANYEKHKYVLSNKKHKDNVMFYACIESG